jgi:hypothetical protein
VSAGFRVPARTGPLAFLTPAALAVLDSESCAPDAMNEADRPGRPHASKDVLKAGQAAVDRLNARRGQS